MARQAASADQSNLPFLASLFLLGRFRDETQRESLNQHFSQQAILSTSTMPNLWTCLTQNGHPDGWPFHKEVRRCPTLPQGPPCSTIGAESLSFRVRNVTGRFPLAMAAETLLIYSFVRWSDANQNQFPTVNREPQSGRENHSHSPFEALTGSQ